MIRSINLLNVLFSFSVAFRNVKFLKRFNSPASVFSSITATDIEQEWKNEEKSKIGVLFLNLGGPAKADDVEEFLYNLFADPDIIRLPLVLSPLQPLIARGISKRRAPRSREAYNSIGGGSPILKYTYQQANLLQKSLASKYNISVKTYIGMRYWFPYTEEALKKISNDKIEALVVLPLYPQFSISTSGSSLRLLQEIFAKQMKSFGEPRLVHTVIPNWHNRRGYVKCVSSLILKELNSFTSDELIEGNNTRHVLFSAHGVPKSYIEVGDPYQNQIEECVELISKDLFKSLPNAKEGVHIHLSYQSRVGPIEWLRPYTDDMLINLGTIENVKNLVVVPISFVSEHIETLEEIDIEYKELAYEYGIKNWRRCPALNTDKIFIEDMADMVYQSLYEPAQTITEACVSNNVENIDSNTQGYIVSSSAAPYEKNTTLTTAAYGEVETILGRIAILGVFLVLLWWK